MASLFASPDIAALVAAFPPARPTRYLPSLVRSNSGNGLVNSTRALERFRTLLETHSNRISKKDLPHRLGIESTDWLFECYDGLPQILCSRDEASLIPDPVWNHFVEGLISRCDESFIGTGSYAKSENMQDLSDEELDKLIECHPLETMGTTSETQDADVYLASKRHVEEIKAGIRSKVANSSDEKLNLSSMYATIPSPVLKQLVRDTIPEDQLELDGDHLIFIPASYHTTQEERLQAERESRIQKLLEQFENDDFVPVNTLPDTSTPNYAEEVSRRYTGLHSDVEVPVILDVDATTKVVVLPVLLQRTIQRLRDGAAALVFPDTDVKSIDSLDDEAMSKLCSVCPEPALAGIVLKIPSYSDEVTATMCEAQLNRQQNQHAHFRDSFQAEIFAPLHLYATGVASITDAKLKSNLDDYVCSHFRREVIPSFFKSARADGSLGNDRAKARETDKFLERCEHAKNVEELNTTACKYAKKVKLQVPNDEDLARVRREILERKALNDVPKMVRGSDVLQNLVWILLSAATEKAKAANSAGDRLALFMSPGKDTGRMIKQYSAIAPEDVETASKLGVWREKLKTASETKEDLEEIRELAKQVVNELIALLNGRANVANAETIA